MATYKVIQDIEAEDKLVGPLTLRQFIYAAVAAVSLYISFLAYTKGASFMLVIFLPVAGVAGFFAFPWKGEQPTEIWALARLRFAVKPRVRIWDQDGAKDLVTITVPKKITTTRPAKALTENEVHSRLKALADTIDSRGWATRNAAYGPYNQGWAHQTVVPAGTGMNISVPADDMFDNQNSVAQNFDAMLAKSSQQNRQRVMQQMAQAQDPNYQQPVPAPVPYPAAPPSPAPAYQQPQMGQPLQYNYAAPAAPQLPAPVLPQVYQPAPAAAGYGQAQPSYATAPTPPADAWFGNGPAYPTNPTPPAALFTPQAVAPSTDVAPAEPVEADGEPVVAPVAPVAPADARIESDAPLPAAAAPTAEDAAMAEDIKQKNAAMTVNYGHMRVLQPLGSDYPAPADDQFDNPVSSVPQPQPILPPAAVAAAPAEPPKPVTPKPDPAILDLANNDDLDIATIARQAKKEIQKSPDEVEIRLH